MATTKAKAATRRKAAPKADSLEARRKKIRERYERPVVVYESDESTLPVYPTRFPKVNQLLGGGFPAGSITELAGVEDSGKSTLAVAIAADIQKSAPPGKKHVVMSNFEHRLDKKASWKWWRTLGLDVSKENFTLFMPTELGAGIAHAVDLLESGEVCCWIIDSVFAAGSAESREAVKAWSDPKGKKAAIGIEAKKWGEAWTAVVPLVYETGTVVIAVNQVREIIEMGSFRAGKGPPRMGTPRGRALKFYSWFRFEAYGSQLDPEKWGDADVDGRRIRLKVIKNGINEAPRGSTTMDLIRGDGFDLTGDLIDSALEAGLITGHGSWYSIQGKRVANGREKLRKLVAESEKLRAWLADGVTKFLAASSDASKDDEGEEGPEVE